MFVFNRLVLFLQITGDFKVCLCQNQLVVFPKMFVESVTETPRSLSLMNSLPGPVCTCTWWNHYLDRCARALGELVTWTGVHLHLVNSLPRLPCTWSTPLKPSISHQKSSPTLNIHNFHFHLIICTCWYCDFSERNSSLDFLWDSRK